MVADYRFERECRTPYSEVYDIVTDDNKIGRVDLHFSGSVVCATLCVGEALTNDDIKELIDVIDEELVTSADAGREDFVITVYQGREVGVFSDQDAEEGEDSEW